MSAFTASSSQVITPSNTTPLVKPVKQLYVGGAGNLSVQLYHDTAPVTLTGVTAGTVLDLHIVQVFATGTTATLLIGLN
jgi:hypothetical protein